MGVRLKCDTTVVRELAQPSQRISPGESPYGGSSPDFVKKKVTESVEPSRVSAQFSKYDFWNLGEI